MSSTFTDGQVLRASALNSAITAKQDASYTPSWAGAVDRQITEKLSEDLSILDLMSVAERSSGDITAALMRSDALAESVRVLIPSGTFTFSKPLQMVRQCAGLQGAGPMQTRLRYAGAYTAADLLTFGDGSNLQFWNQVGGFQLTSDTTMTDGFAIRFKLAARFKLHDIAFDDQDHRSTGKLCNGVWFDGIDMGIFTDFMMGTGAKMAGTALRVNGTSGNTPPNADLTVDRGKITGWNYGTHVAGGFGGFYGGAVDVIGNNYNMVVDCSVISQTNREVTLGTQWALDTATTTGLLVNNPLGGMYLISSGWIASSGQDNWRTVSNPGGQCQWNGGRCLNAGRDGFRNEDKTCRVMIGGALSVDNCAGHGINLTPINQGDYLPANCVVDGAISFSNNGGNVNPPFLGPTLLWYTQQTLDADGSLDIDTGIENLNYKLTTWTVSIKGTSGEAIPLAPFDSSGNPNYTIDGSQAHIRNGTANGAVRICVFYQPDADAW